MARGEVTRLLTNVRDGDRAAASELFALVYDELRRMARRRLASRRRGQTLNTTALVHEAYLKLVNGNDSNWNDRQHFFRVAARAMRQICVDHVRTRNRQKRGGGRVLLTLDESQVAALDRTDDLMAIDHALSRLGALNERLARVVELRFFCGLSIEETAEVLSVAERTVIRDWRKARAYLYLLLTDGAGA